MKVQGEGCYYHLMNRAAGRRGEKPFNQVDMEYGFRLLQNLCEYFLIEVISAAWMGNHFHVIVYAPGPDELPSIEDISKRHNRYYKQHVRQVYLRAETDAENQPGQSRNMPRSRLENDRYQLLHARLPTTFHRRLQPIPRPHRQTLGQQIQKRHP